MENNMNNQNDGSKAIEEFWIKNRLPKEVESLPYEILSKEEQEVIDKVRNGEDLSQEEINLIKKTRIEYEAPLKKYDANEIIKSNETLNEILGTEQELLEFVYNKEPPVIKVQLPINGVDKVFNFTVKPLEDSSAVKFLEPHIDIFKDLSDEEQKIYNKNQNNQALDVKEKRVLEHIQEKISQNQTRSQMENITELLATQIEEPKSLSFEEKKAFWSNFNFVARVQIYSRVMEKLGLTEDFNNRLFLDE